MRILCYYSESTNVYTFFPRCCLCSVKEAQEPTEQRAPAEKPSLFGFLLQGGGPPGFRPIPASSAADNPPEANAREEEGIVQAEPEASRSQPSHVKNEPVEASRDEEGASEEVATSEVSLPY
jgi:hypothetical protein